MQEVELSLDSRRYVQAFAPVLAHLQRLWELVITAQVGFLPKAQSCKSVWQRVMPSFLFFKAQFSKY